MYFTYRKTSLVHSSSEECFTSQRKTSQTTLRKKNASFSRMKTSYVDSIMFMNTSYDKPFIPMGMVLYLVDADVIDRSQCKECLTVRLQYGRKFRKLYSLIPLRSAIVFE